MSYLEDKVYSLLRELFPYYSIRREVNVQSINPEYRFSNHRFDLVITNLKIVFECHGIQHYEINEFFAGGDKAQAQFNLQDIQHRDKQKKQAALEAGYAYVSIPYSLQINTEVISDLIRIAMEQQKYFKQPQAQKNQKSEYEIMIQEKAKEYRRKKYKEFRKWLKENKNGVD